MGFRTTASYDLGTLDAADENTGFLFSGDFRNAVFTITADNSANCTIKFYASNSEDRPDLDSAVSATNDYTTTQVILYPDHSTIDGDTGVVFDGTKDGTYRYEINENGNTWVGVKMTARTAGDVTVKLHLTDNQ